MKPTLVVLAAGMGSRYGGLKQVDPVGPNDELIIDYSVYDAIRAGFGKIVFVIRQDIDEVFREKIGSRYEGKIEVAYAYQELDKVPSGFQIPEGRQKPWGTGHAILVAKDVVNEPFAVINADDFYGKSGYDELAGHLSKLSGDSTEYCMCGFILRNTLSDNGTVSRGICREDESGFLVDVEEMTKIERVGNGGRNIADEANPVALSGDEIVSMNMWGFSPTVFEQLETQFGAFLDKEGQELKSEFYIPFVVDQLVKEGEATVTVLKSVDSWFGITYKEDKPGVVASVKGLVDSDVYPSSLFG